MTPQPAGTGTITWKLPYDNTALRERIGTTEVVERSVVSELVSVARAAVDAESADRSRRSWRRTER